MKTVLVTGGNGFIGRYVTSELLGRGYGVTVFDTRGRPPVAGATVTLGDIRDAASVTEAVSRSEGVIHLAGLLGTAEMIADPRPAIETNIGGAINVFEAASRHDVPCVNIAIGNHWMDNTYSISKDTADRFGRMYNEYRRTHITTVRTFDAYGPGQVPPAPFGPSRVRKIIPSFACRALTGQDIEVYGTGEQVIDLIHASDVARVLVEALEATERVGPLPLIEAGTGQPISVIRVAEIIADIVAPLRAEGVTIRHLPMRAGEKPGAVIVSNTTTLAPLGINPKTLIPFVDGIGPTVDHYASIV